MCQNVETVTLHPASIHFINVQMHGEVITMGVLNRGSDAKTLRQGEFLGIRVMCIEELPPPQPAVEEITLAEVNVDASITDLQKNQLL